MKKIIIAFILLGSMTGCTDAEQSKIVGYGNKFTVELINCDGTCTHKWRSSGKVLSETNTDGYYFNDDSTGKLVEVTGNLIITKD